MRTTFAVLLSVPVLVLSACQPSAGTDADPAAVTPVADAVPASATWALDPAASRIAFASIKATEAIETHFFPGLSGEINATGEAAVTVPLDQVETKVDIRNERVRTMFFETDTYPTATISTAVNPADFADLATGERRQTEIEGKLALHGAEAPLYVDAFVTRIAADRIEISSAEPVIVYVSDFDLDAGLEALREIAGLPSITSAVPVSFTFVFDAKV
ncbi:MAG: YceI family protein [Pseudomonadota bacterium]